MELGHFVAFNLALLAALISPGPAMLISIRSTLTSGRRSGIATGVGLAGMAALWTLTALLGLDAIFRIFPVAYIAFKICGGLYLIYIAVQTWRHATLPMSEAPLSQHRAFLAGFLVNLANPKSILFAAAVLVVIFPPGLNPAQMALIITNHFLVELAVYTLIACLISTESISQGYLRAKPTMDRITAGVLGALGLRLLTDR